MLTHVIYALLVMGLITLCSIFYMYQNLPQE